MRSRLLPALAAVLAGLAVVAAITGVVLHGRGDPLKNLATSGRDIPFARKTWLLHPDTPTDFTRGAMSLDLVHHVLRRGMSTGRVRRLLGPPDFGGRREYGYFVGEARKYSGGYVTIRFDKAGRLQRARRIESGGGF